MSEKWSSRFAAMSLSTFAILSSANAVEFAGSSGFKNCTPVKIGLASFSVVSGTGVNLSLPDRDAELHITWARGQYPFPSTNFIRFTVQNTGPTAVDLVFSLECSSGSGEVALGASVSVPNDRPVTMLMPLVSAQSLVKMPMFPSPVNNMYQLRTLGSANLGGARRLRILNRDYVPVTLKITDISSVYYPIPTSQFIDALGQQKLMIWPGKLDPTNPAALAMMDPPVSGMYPYPADSFGAIQGTGSTPRARFGLARDTAGRWSLVAPSGNRFFSTGICAVGACVWGLVGDRQNFYQSLPPKTAPYTEHWWSIVGSDGRNIDTLNQYSLNLFKKYGSGWKPLAYSKMVQRMKTWGFNTLAAAYDPSVDSTYGMPSAPVIGIRGPHKRLPSVRGGALMSDAYDPAFPNSVATSIASQLTAYPENALQIGLFVDNELPWGDVNSSDRSTRYLVPYATLRGPSNQPAKVQFVNDMTNQYGSIGALNTSWGTTYSSWSAMLNNAFTWPTVLKPGLVSDFNAFTLAFARKYFQTVRTALTNRGYQGLYLGCRFDSMTPESEQACKEYCDVLSFNCYEKNPDIHFSFLKNIDFPVLISEFGFGASDNGRIGWGLYQTLSESDRVAAYVNYANRARQWSNLVGLHYYKWEDHPFSGDSVGVAPGDNTSSGLVSICDVPYPLITQSATDMNRTIMESFTAIP